MQSWMIGMVSGLIVTGFLPVLPPGYAAALLIFPGVMLLALPSPLARFAAGMAIGCALGVLHGTDLLRHRIADDCVRRPLLVAGQVVSLPRQGRTPDGGTRQRFEFAVDELSPAYCSGPRRLLLFHYGDERVAPGDRWQFEVSLRKPWGNANPGSFNMQAWFVERGIDAVGSVRASGTVRQLEPAAGLRGLHHRHRLGISERIGELDLDASVTAILRAVTVADKGGIDHHLWGLFQQFGLNHLLVISGLHVGMVAAVGYLLGGAGMRLAGLGATWMPGVCALVLATLFAALAGFSLPTQRALCMLGCFVGAELLARRSDASRSLLLAAALVLALNPLAAVGSGFWLSFGAVAALLWLLAWQQGRGLPGRWLGTHVFMALFMLPMGALFFAGGSLVAAPANLLMIPLVGWFVVPLGLLGSVSCLAGLTVAEPLWRLAAWPLSHLLPPAEQLSRDAGGWLYLPLSATPPEALLGVIAVFLLALPGTRAPRLLALVLALPALLPVRTDPGPPSLRTSVSVLDVGQGTAVVIRSGDRALLYDTGGGDPAGSNMGTSVVLPYLRSVGIAALDTVVVSHPDLDHSAGAAAVLDALAVGRYRYGGKSVVARGGRPCVAGEAWRWPGGQVFRILSPALEAPPRRNNESCVLQVEVGGYRLLLPGDIDSDRERALAQYWGDRLGADWLLAAHHGSGTSSAATFLKHVRPRTAVISRGYANRFGHPHRDVAGRLDRLGVAVWDTATGGALEFSLAPGEPVAVAAHRHLVRRYWM